MVILVNYSSDDDDEMENLAKRAVNAAPEVPAEEEPEIAVSEQSNAGGIITGLYLDKASLKRGPEPSRKRKKTKTKRRKGNVEDDYLGPWADFDEDSEPEPSQTEKLPEPESEPEDEAETAEPHQPTSFLMSSNAQYMDLPPTKVNLTKISGSQECFVPKKVIHTYEGHTKGTSKIRFFPGTGHLLLSCGNDAIIRLWDVYRNRELLREYCGHTEPVKDIVFNKEGDRFLSCSFDKYVRLWDTLSGEILESIEVEAVPTSLQFNPNDESEFIVGLMNHKIEHYSLKDGSHIQTYSMHLSGISSLTVIDNGSKFISTADDKSVIIWKWGINIPPKSIPIGSSYAVASVAVLPPFGKYVALQDMKDTIHVIEGTDKFRTKQKSFKNFNITGYKIDIAMSPDGKILCSGDSKGNVLFWDWHKTALISKLKLAPKLITTIGYHPQEQSKVAAAGSDGKIYYCD